MRGSLTQNTYRQYMVTLSMAIAQNVSTRLTTPSTAACFVSPTALHKIKPTISLSFFSKVLKYLVRLSILFCL